MNKLLLIPIAISFLLTVIILPKWIKKCRQVGLLWEDMNKYGEPRTVASSGGLVVVMSFVIGVLFYVAFRTFFIGTNGITSSIFALLSVILILSVIGLSDDLLGWQHGGLSARFRILLALIASIPLAVINAGVHRVAIPFFGIVNLGLIYPLVLIPLGIAGAATTYNFLAGYNGLEAGQGVLIITFLSFVAYITGSPWLSIIGLTMVGSLFAFLYYNKFPAKVFPGDILTYVIGALIAIMAIMGNFERIAVLVFMPYIIETGLKLRGRLKKQSFGKPQIDGSLTNRYKKFYGLEHLAIAILEKIKKEGKAYEIEVVFMIYGFQIFWIVIGAIIFLT